MDLLMDESVYSCFTLLPLIVGASKGQSSVSGSYWVGISKVFPSAPINHGHSVPFLSAFVVK